MFKEAIEKTLQEKKIIKNHPQYIPNNIALQYVKKAMIEGKKHLEYLKDK